MKYRKAKIVCTVGHIAEPKIEDTIERFIEAGADALRLNMGHFDVNAQADQRYLEKLITSIRQVSSRADRAVAIIGDIQGPKIRIKNLLGKLANSERAQLQKDSEFILTFEDPLSEKIAGASLRTEGQFDLFDEIRKNVHKDERGNPKPIQFWLGDGKVILEAEVSDVTVTSIPCQVVVGGELKKGQGISVRNSSIRSGIYRLADHPKDRADVDFLLQKEVDFFALSMVNEADDVKSLHSYIRLRIADVGLPTVEDTFCGLKEFPVIAKIETPEGFTNLSEIMAVSAAIMVARGDLALHTGIDRIGVLQKQIITECVTAGKPVITATQMLLSMTEFREPRRSEVTDVTNAIIDGTDGLMLSEETADPYSKFPIDSISMMAQIAVTTEDDVARRNQLEYKYKIGKQHDRNLENLREKKKELDRERRGGRINSSTYSNRKLSLERLGITDHMSYDACENATELRCKAIVILTETGESARLVSRFRPDIPILAGVYSECIARNVRLSYGVEAFTIDRKRQRVGHPFEQYEQIIEQAKNKGFLARGDLVMLVGGYPHPASGVINFLHAYEVQ